jgi:hypothetical protein
LSYPHVDTDVDLPAADRPLFVHVPVQQLLAGSGRGPVVAGPVVVLAVAGNREMAGENCLAGDVELDGLGMDGESDVGVAADVPAGRCVCGRASTGSGFRVPDV